MRIAGPRSVAALSNQHGGTFDACLAKVIVERIVENQEALGAGDLIVVSTPRWLPKAFVPGAVYLCSRNTASRLPEGCRWIHDHPLWVLAEMLEQSGPAVSSEARSLELPHDVSLGPGAVVLPGARLGSGCVIGPNAVVYENVQLGRRVQVGANAVIGRPGFGWVTGPGGQRRRMPQLGGVVIGDDVEIGPLCTVDAGTLRATRIDSKVKLDAHVHVGHNVWLGAESIVAAQVGFAGSVRIGRQVSVGGQAGFADHVSVGDGARVAAKSGVIGDVPPGAVVAGYPAVPRIRWLRAFANLLRQAS